MRTSLLTALRNTACKPSAAAPVLGIDGFRLEVATSFGATTAVDSAVGMRSGPLRSLLNFAALCTIGSCVASDPVAVKQSSSSIDEIEIEIDASLGESLWRDEGKSTEIIARAIAADIRKRHQAGEGLARRDAHPKAHGCVRGSFLVNEQLDPSLAYGVFRPGMKYRTWMRFSNANPAPRRDDAKADARGLAIKLVGIPGDKLSPDEKNTQDFILINNPVFFADDPTRYASVVEKGLSTSALDRTTAPLALGISGVLIGAEVASSHIANPLFERFWSTVPYRLGDDEHKQAIKFSVKPCNGMDNKPDAESTRDPDFLRKAMRVTLEKGEACFDFLVQPRTTTMSVEKSMLEWKEADAPFISVARIIIEKQSFDSPTQDAFCENLSFSPWHSLPEHRPLGAVNRIRRVVYDAISSLRHELNGVSRAEPTGQELFGPADRQPAE